MRFLPEISGGLKRAYIDGEFPYSMAYAGVEGTLGGGRLSMSPTYATARTHKRRCSCPSAVDSSMAFTSSIISCICLSRAVPWNGRCPVLRLSSSVRRIRSSDAAMSRSLYSTSGKNFESHLTLKMCDIRQLLGGADPRPGQDFHEPNQRVGTYFKQAAFLYNPPLVPDPVGPRTQ